MNALGSDGGKPQAVLSKIEVNGADAGDAGLAIVAVLVIYERSLADVESWPILSTLLTRRKWQSCQLAGLVVYDNSPSPRAAESARIKGCIYLHNPGNGGTAAAYAKAAAIAQDGGVNWLLLLDQDTQIPENFLEAAASRVAQNRSTCPDALVPWVAQNGLPVSPATVTQLGTIRPLARSVGVINDRSFTAIASGSVMHVQTLLALLPFPDALWLDYVDHWMFRMIHNRRGVVEVFDCELEHNLSVSNLNSVDRRRLLSILNGEYEFNRLLGRLPRAVYPLRVATRILRYLFSRPQLALWTSSWLFKRLGVDRR